MNKFKDQYKFIISDKQINNHYQISNNQSNFVELHSSSDTEIVFFIFRILIIIR